MGRYNTISPTRSDTPRDQNYPQQGGGGYGGDRYDDDQYDAGGRGAGRDTGRGGAGYGRSQAPAPRQQQDYRQNNPYAQRDDVPAYNGGGAVGGLPSRPVQAAGGYPPPGGAGAGQYEMGPVGGVAPPPVKDKNAFFTEIKEIKTALRTFQDNVSQIEDLHSRSLVNISQDQVEWNSRQLEQKLSETRGLTNTLKNRIRKLESDNARLSKQDPDRAMLDGQVKTVKKNFLDQIQSFQQVEMQYRQKYKARMEREYRIVKPDATPEEVQAVVNDKSGGQVFQQALLNSNRYGDARGALREVQERHEDILKINQTIVELDQLFNEMHILIGEQEVAVDHIAQQAERVDVDVEQALDQTNKAVVSARAARKKRWICFFIIIILIIVIVLVVYFTVIRPMQTASNAGKLVSH